MQSYYLTFRTKYFFYVAASLFLTPKIFFYAESFLILIPKDSFYVESSLTLTPKRRSAPDPPIIATIRELLKPPKSATILYTQIRFGQRTFSQTHSIRSNRTYLGEYLSSGFLNRPQKFEKISHFF